MEPFEGAAESIVDALGETYVYFDGVSAIEVQAVPSSGSMRVDGERGPPVRSRRRELQILRSAVAEPKQGDLLFRGTLDAFEGLFDTEVVSVRPDEESTVNILICKAVDS